MDFHQRCEALAAQKARSERALRKLKEAIEKEQAQYLEPGVLVTSIKKGVKIILSGWQGTNFPISYLEQDKVKNEYMLLIHGKENMPRKMDGKPRRAHTGDFLGPSSVSLEIKNIMSIDIDSSVPNINKPYTFRWVGE